DIVVTPVSCNSAVEKCGFFKKVHRTKIGSPYVIEWMQRAEAEGSDRVIGYEANGGFLIQTQFEAYGKVLKPLPTRDAIIVQLGILLLSIKKNKKVSELLSDLPQRITYSDRLKEFPTEKSKAKIAELYSGDPAKDRPAIEAVFKEHFGKVKSLDATDGVRITFENEEVIHLRPSGNAPEFRCYSEADTETRAVEINKLCMNIMAGWK
ncbi:MAG: phosphomannomutase, partial [Deltaproteobacteria bacterium]|nr:phosphomannomutase [Deltaproteobacteria bacterium]